jgi:hypothetical protein
MRVVAAFVPLLSCSAEILFENPAEVQFSGHDYGSSTGWVYSMTTSSDVQWGRLYFKIDNVDTSPSDGYVHVTFVELENAITSVASNATLGSTGTQPIRIVDSVGSTRLMRESPGSSVQHLLNIDTGYDGEIGKTTDYVYAWTQDAWTCLEWNTDASQQHAALYDSGAMAFSVDDWTFQGNQQSHHYSIPSDLDLRIGMFTYNGISVSGAFKDVVVATERVGCGSTTAPPDPPSPPSPVPSGCPGGSLKSCMDMCPAAAFQPCVEECLNRCSSGVLV